MRRRFYTKNRFDNNLVFPFLFVKNLRNRYLSFLAEACIILYVIKIKEENA